MKFEENELNLIRFCSNETGIPYKLLKNYVVKLLKDEESGKQKQLSKIKNIIELTKDELKELRKQVYLGSVFLCDYENTFGIDRNMLSEIMQGYEEEIYYLIDENGGDFKDYDNNETLYNYICGIEFDDEYLKQMTKQAKDEIEQEYNLKEEIFEQEYIYNIASMLQYKIIGG